MKKELTESTKQILNVLRQVPAGEVMSYRDVARAANLPNGARQVARILHSMSKKYELPWWRIIRADGSIALPEPARSKQIQLLKEEGVAVSEQGKVNLKRKTPLE